MSCFKQIKGFTLIELVVVIALISIMLFFAIPRFHGNFLSDSTKEVTRWILLKVPYIKERAAREQKSYILHVSFDSNKLWLTNDAMPKDSLQSAEENGYQLPEDIKLLDVEYPDQEKISTGEADINFTDKGYSDKAIIHLENDDNEQFSFLIEPFLSRVRMYNSYAGFAD